MKESQEMVLVISHQNGDTKVTVKAPTNGDKGTVDFGDAKVIAKN